MQLSQPLLTRSPPRVESRPQLSEITRKGVRDLLELRSSPLSLEASLDQWTGFTYGALVDLHRQQHSLPSGSTSDEFTALAYTHPDIHVANMLGCQLGGAEYAERAVIGVTGHGMGTVHEAVSLLAETDHHRRRGTLWVFDQKSPFPLGSDGAFEGDDIVYTIGINQSDASWEYLGTTLEPADPAEPGSNGLGEAWVNHLQVCNLAEDKGTPAAIVDVDRDLALRWTSHVRTMTVHTNDRLVASVSSS